MNTDIDIRHLVTTEYLDLADLADTLNAAAWDTPSLCDGLRVREVIAHMTMLFRHDGRAALTGQRLNLRAVAHDYVTSRDVGLPATDLGTNLYIVEELCLDEPAR